MTRITVKKTKRGEWIIAQGQDWRVQASTFAKAALEARHYGMLYGSFSEVNAAIEQAMLP